MENKEQSVEAVVLKEIGINKLCCRRHMLTHVDVI
jgi:DNA-directed RNA polymerase subunit N (RpoN/RPB10)